MNKKLNVVIRYIARLNETGKYVTGKVKKKFGEWNSSLVVREWTYRTLEKCGNESR